MDSVNSPPDTQSKLPGLALNFLASLGAGLNAGSAASGPFADLMAQIKTTISLNPNPAPNQTTTLSQFQHSPQNQASNDANTTNASNSSSDQTSVDPQDVAALRKFLKQQTKADNGKSKSGNSGNDNSGPQISDQAQPNNDTQAAIDGGVQVTATTKNPAPDNSPAGTSDANTINSDTLATPPVADTVTNPVTDPNANALNVLLSANTGTSVSSATTANESTNNASGKTAASASVDVSESDLMMLLLELERLAAAQLAATLPAGNAGSPNADNTAQSPNADGAQTQITPGANTENKIDLRALLAAIAGLNDGTQADIPAPGQNNAALTDNGQDTASAAATTTALQSGASASSDASQSTSTANKWMNAEFLNLFNLSNSNPGTPAAPLAFNPAAAAAAAVASGDGNASLDSNTQGQNGASARNSATGLTANSNASLSATATVQASNPYDFASQLSALRATKGGTAGLPTPVEQVVLQLSRGLNKDGSSQMTIQLRPAELGRIDVKLNVDSEGKVQGIISADNPHTLHLLLKDVGGLERALQEAGLRADSGCLQFNLRGDGQPDGSRQTAGNQSEFDNGNAPADSIIALSEFADLDETYYLTPGGVNIRV